MNTATTNTQASTDDFIENGAAVKRLTRDIAAGAATMTASEARFLVDYYYICQDDRIRFNGQVRAMTETEEPNMVLGWLGEQATVLESQVKRALDKYTDAHPIGQWIKSQYGFGPVLAAGFLAHIDITKAPTAGHIWSYAGIVPGKEWVSRADSQAWVKANGLNVELAAQQFNRDPERMYYMATHDIDGDEIKLTAASLAAAISKRPWNAELKKLVWKAGECLIKFSNRDDCYYGRLFKQRKAYEWKRNLDGSNLENILKEQDKYGATTESFAWVNGCYKADVIKKLVDAGGSLAAAEIKALKGPKGSGDPMLPPEQLKARARRWAMKIFLSHLHEVWYEHEFKRRVPNPFVLQHLGHVHRIAVPGYNSPYAGDVPTVDLHDIDPKKI